MVPPTRSSTYSSAYSNMLLARTTTTKAHFAVPSRLAMLSASDRLCSMGWLAFTVEATALMLVVAVAITKVEFVELK